jgi:hypothetical protein
LVITPVSPQPLHFQATSFFELTGIRKIVLEAIIACDPHLANQSNERNRTGASEQGGKHTDYYRYQPL